MGGCEASKRKKQSPGAPPGALPSTLPGPKGEETVTRENRKARQVAWGLSAVLVLALANAGCDSLDPQVRAEESPALAADDSTPRPSAARSADLGIAHQLSEAFEDVADHVRPSVVSVSTRRGIQRSMQQGNAQQPQGNPFQESPFGDFFDHFFGPGGPQFGPGMEQPQEGLGSGFVV